MDDSCVVFGSGGGLGIHALQVAQTHTSNVIGFTSSPSKLEEIGKYEASPTFLLDDSLDPTDLVMALTEDKGADVIFNSVGSKFLKSSVSSLSHGGRVLMMGELLGGNGSLNTSDLLFKNGSVIGSTGAGKPHIQSAVNMVRNGNVVPVVGGMFPLHDIKEAFHLMKNKASVGRLVLIP
jgi:D-arabinose 1-dehydrogenase-like Zn-dependent alcohol dehydrogenase